MKQAARMQAYSRLRKGSSSEGWQDLRILAHEPAIAAHYKVSDEERNIIIESLLAQKAGSNPKAMQLCKEMRREQASNTSHGISPTDHDRNPLSLNSDTETGLDSEDKHAASLHEKRTAMRGKKHAQAR